VNLERMFHGAGEAAGKGAPVFEWESPVRDRRYLPVSLRRRRRKIVARQSTRAGCPSCSRHIGW